MIEITEYWEKEHGSVLCKVSFKERNEKCQGYHHEKWQTS